MAELLSAIASLLWPVLAALFVWTFKAEISALLKRLSQIQRGKLFGQEFELTEELVQLEQITQEVQEKAAALPQPEEPRVMEKGPSEALEVQLLRDASQSPKLTLMLLSAEIDKELRRLLAETGWNRIKRLPFDKAISQLQAQGSLPEYVIGAARLFRDVRNKILHGGTATNDDILRAIDSGFSLLKSIGSIPREANVVHQVGVPLYSDEAATVPTTDASGIILKTTTAEGAVTRFRIFPTTRTHFEVGNECLGIGI